MGSTRLSFLWKSVHPTAEDGDLSVLFPRHNCRRVVPEKHVPGSMKNSCVLDSGMFPLNNDVALGNDCRLWKVS